MAKAAKCTIAEVEEIVPVGTLDPDQIHLPGVYVHRLIKGEHYEKRIEKLTVASDGKEGESTDSPAAKRREKIVRRAAKEFKVMFLIYRNAAVYRALTISQIGW